MAEPRVRTPLVVAVDRIIKSLSLAPYFLGKKIATLGRRWTFSGPFLRSRPVISPFFLLAGLQREKRAREVGIRVEGER